MNMPDFKELIDCIRREEVTLFIGSGFSFKAGGPKASDIVKAIKDAISEEERHNITSDDLKVVAKEYEEMYDRDRLIQILEKVLAFDPEDMSDHETLTKIPHFHTIITTNYDTLLEDAYGSDAYVVRTTKDCVNHPKDKTIIYKIHGDLIARNNIVITQDDYYDYFNPKKRKEPFLWSTIASQILTKDILFIGYSLEDGNVFQLINDIKNAVGGNTRRFFLISPGMKNYKINRLAKTNVTYYDAKAEDLFPRIFETLNKKIHDDFKKKRISAETFRRYCELHQLYPNIKPKDNRNEVTFETQGNENVRVRVDIPFIVGERIVNKDPAVFNDLIPELPVPTYKIEGDALKDISVEMNGMVIGDRDDYNAVFIAPTFNNTKVSIRIPDIHFNEIVTFTKYYIGETLHLKATLESFELTFKIKHTPENNNETCVCNVSLLKSYDNNSEALKWIELPIALWEGKEFVMSIFPSIKMHFPPKENFKTFKQIKRYYENIKEIEFAYNVNFEKYAMCTDENMKTASSLLKWKENKFVGVEVDGSDSTVSFDILMGVDDIKANFEQNGDASHTFLISNSTEEVFNIPFNGIDFQFKYRHVIIPEAKIISMKNISNTEVKTRIVISNKGVRYILLTDKKVEDMPSLEGTFDNVPKSASDIYKKS